MLSEANARVNPTPIHLFVICLLSVCYLFLGFTGDVSVEFGSVVGVAIFSNFGHAKVLAASTTAKIKNPIPIEIGSDAFSTSPRPNNRNTAPSPPKKAEPK